MLLQPVKVFCKYVVSVISTGCSKGKVCCLLRVVVPLEMYYSANLDAHNALLALGDQLKNVKYVSAYSTYPETPSVHCDSKMDYPRSIV